MSEIPLKVANGIFEADMALSGLAGGDYLIEFAAKAESGEAKDVIAFRVGR